MATNKDVVHNFIKQTGRARHNNYPRALLYSEDVLYSYDTAIAQVHPDTRTILLLDSFMTATTAKHKSVVVSEAIDNNYKILPIPLKMGSSNFPTTKEIIDRFEARMDYLSRGTDLALSNVREKFITTYTDYKEYQKYANTVSANTSKYDTIFNNLNDTGYIKDLQRKRREFQTQLAKDKRQIFYEMDTNNG